MLAEICRLPPVSQRAITPSESRVSITSRTTSSTAPDSVSERPGRRPGRTAPFTAAPPRSLDLRHPAHLERVAHVAQRLGGALHLEGDAAADADRTAGR